MKKLIVILFLLFASVVYGSEKETLQLQQTLLQERIGRLQAEYTISIGQLKEIQDKLKVLEATEKEVKDKKQ